MPKKDDTMLKGISTAMMHKLTSLGVAPFDTNITGVRAVGVNRSGELKIKEILKTSTQPVNGDDLYLITQLVRVEKK